MLAKLSARLVACCLLFTAHALGDEVVGLRSEHVVERRHAVELVYYRGHAKLTVKRSVYNGGDRHDQTTFWIDVPHSAVATGLRTLGSFRGKPHWFAGELMEAEAAAERYRELTGVGGYYPKDPALLSWRHQGLLALQVFPCAPREEKSVEYTLLVPATYRDGAYHLSLPKLGSEDLTASVKVRAANPRDRLRVGATPVASGKISNFKAGQIDLELIPDRAASVEPRLAAIRVAAKRALNHYEFLAAPRISSAPVGAWVVVMIDGSRSFSDERRAAAAAAARATLAHFKAARVEIISFDRKLERRFKRFADVASARAELEHFKLKSANGSAVDEALFEAGKLLAKAPAGKARRILLLTDGYTRSRLTPARVKAALSGTGALAQIGIVSESAPKLERDDNHPWAEAAHQTGGLVWMAEAKADDPKLTGVYEEWARPLRLDRVKLFSADLPIGASESVPDVLDEGQSIQAAFISDRPLSSVRLEGELWSKPVSYLARPDAARAKLEAALVFGSPLLDELSEPEMMKLATLGGAVSPVTSYLAIEPGVRPSTEGLDHGALSGAGFGMGAPQMRMAVTSVAPGMLPLDRDRYLSDQLSQGYRACGGQGRASLTLESTADEVVDVVSVSLPAPDAILEKCLREAAWDLVLPGQFNDEWTVYRVDIQA